VRAAVGTKVALLCKTNLRDGFRGGLELSDAVDVARALEAEGADALVLSGGFTSKSPFFLFRGRRPLAGMIAVEKSRIQKLALRWFGAKVIASTRSRRCSSSPTRQCAAPCACRWHSWAASSRARTWTPRWPRGSTSWPWAAR
jgi:2,4-dienoyl-CoA reductase-like NADH-dependent reductase (Old Yellow Enzyme family)